MNSLSTRAAGVLLGTLAAASISLPAQAGLPGDLGDAVADADFAGQKVSVAEYWATIDDHKYTSAADRNGVTEVYQLQFAGSKWQYGTRKVAKNMGLDSASGMSALPDVSGDKRADMLVRFGESMYLYTSDAEGGLTRKVEVGHGWGAMGSVIFAGHLNGDNTNYLLGRRDSDQTLWAYTISNSGTVVGKGQVGHGWGGMKFILGAGQMVGDAKTDLLGIDEAGTMYCYRGIGGGKIVQHSKCGHGWTGFRSVFVAGDMTNDTRWDVVGVKEPTNPNANGEPIIPAGKTLSDVKPEDRSPMYLYKNAGNAVWYNTGMIGHDMFQFRLFA